MLTAQFSPKVGDEGCIAIRYTNSAIINWASSCEVARGWVDIADTSLGRTTYGDAENALGVSDPAVVSLGDVVFRRTYSK